MTRRVSLVEMETAGHRLWYARLVIDRLAERADPTEIAIYAKEGAPSSPEWQVHLADCNDHIVHEVAAQSFNPSHLLRRASVGGAKIIIPDGDEWLPAVSRTRGLTDISLLLSRPFPGGSPTQRARWAAKMGLAHFAAARPGARVLRLGMTENEDQPPSRIEWVPDPVHLACDFTREQARRELALPTASNVSLLCGGLSERKALSRIVAAWRGVKDPNCRLVCVGSCHDPRVLRTLLELEASDDRVILRLGYVSNFEFDSWIAAADRTLNLYDNVGSSGVALKSWAAGIPVVALRGSYLAQQLEALQARLHLIRGDDLCELTPVLAGLDDPTSGRRPLQGEIRQRTTTFADGLIGPL